VILDAMRRTVATIMLCVLAAALSVVIAACGSGKNSSRPAVPGHGLANRFSRPELRRLSPLPHSPNGTTCFVSSRNQNCSLIPCKGFVSAARPDWIPVTPECGPVGSLEPRSAVPVGPRLPPPELFGAPQMRRIPPL
jgi:hypothetical protein